MNIDCLFNLIDEKEAVSFLQSLIQINSVNPPGNELEMTDLIRQRFEKCGLSAAIDLVGTNRANIMAKIGGPLNVSQAQLRKHLVLSGHLDTVPVGNEKWEHQPWSADLVGNRLYGRGASDMKSGTAAMVLALVYLHQSGLKLNGVLSFLGTAGEEVDGIGAQTALNKNIIHDARAIVIGEPTNNTVTIAHKGVIWLEIIIKGKTAHAGWPEKGINAIAAMHEFVSQLKKLRLSHHKLLGDSTINLGTIHGGIAPNMLADQCRLTIDIRTVPGQKHEQILLQIRKILSDIASELKIRAKLKVLNNMLCVSTSENNDFIQLSADVLRRSLKKIPMFKGANYYSDASLFTKELNGIPILIFGPGDPNLAHQPNEWVDTRQYIDAIRYYMALAVDYLGVSE